jgi:hypothetical protein
MADEAIAVTDILQSIPVWWRTVLIFAQVLAYVTFVMLGIFGMFAKREWNRMTRNTHDLRNSLHELALSVGTLTVALKGFGDRFDKMDNETRDNGKAISRIEGQLDRVLNGGGSRRSGTH